MVDVVARERPAAATSSEGSEASSLRRRYHILLIGILLAGALLLRVSGINQPSVEQRETQSALLARGWYLGDASGLPAWKQGVLHELRASVKPIEPPILDYITSLEFRLTGENFWFPRLLSSLLWVLGGVFLYLIASRLTTRAGALVALALYLTWPYAVWLSRHFMPDAMMVSGLLAAALTVIRYWEQPSPRRLIVAGAVSCLATAIKPGVAFLFLVALFASQAVSRRQLVASLARGRLPLFALLTAAAAVGYYVWGTYFSDFISPTADVARVTPDFVVTSQFWKGWWEMVSYLLRYPQPQALLALVPISAGLAGIALARGTARAVLVGLSLGYVAFALTFSTYIHTNPYYSLQLIPILSLAIGVLAGSVLQRVQTAARVALFGLVAIVVAIAALKSHSVLTETHTRQTIADYRRIGQITGHTTRAMIVDRELGTPAIYWGWIVGHGWDLGAYPRTPPDPAKFDFLVVEGVDQLATAQGLRHFVRGLPVVARTSRYAIFDLRGRYARKPLLAPRPKRP